MIPIQSTMENREDEFVRLQSYLNSHQFTLGGNWDYDHGYFDRSLDERQKIWLRIPFQVTHGEIEGELGNSDATIKLGSPFVLKHLYNDGLDGEAQINTYGAFVNQFQEPVDRDADVESKWVKLASDVLNQVEQGLSR